MFFVNAGRIHFSALGLRTTTEQVTYQRHHCNNQPSKKGTPGGTFFL